MKQVSLPVSMSGRARAWSLVLVAILGAAAQRPASAQPVPGPATLVEQASVAAKEGRYQEALDRLHEADRQAPASHLHFLMALYLVELGRNGEALGEYEYVVEHADPADRERFEARQEIARIEPLVGVVTVAGAAPGITYSVDGAPRTPTARGIVVDPGVHTITASAAGFEPFARQVTVEKGQSVPFTPDLKPARVVSAPTGPTGPQPVTRPPDGEPGEAGRAGFLDRHRWSVRVGAGAAGVALAGIGLGIWTQRDYADLAKTCAYTVLGCPQDRIDGVERKALMTNVAFGVAAAGAIGAGVLYVLESRRAGAESSAVTVLPTGRGAAVSVRF